MIKPFFDHKNGIALGIFSPGRLSRCDVARGRRASIPLCYYVMGQAARPYSTLSTCLDTGGGQMKMIKIMLFKNYTYLFI